MHDETARGARLVAALEDLVAQEALALRAQEFSVVQEVQDRIAPLVAELGSDQRLFRDSALQERLRAVHARRAESSTWLDAALEKARGELRDLGLARGRAARIAPVYGSPSTASRSSSSLNCVG